MCRFVETAGIVKLRTKGAGVGVGDMVGVGDNVGVGDTVGVGDSVGVGEAVGVGDSVGVGDNVGVGVTIGDGEVTVGTVVGAGDEMLSPLFLCPAGVKSAGSCGPIVPTLSEFKLSANIRE